MSTEYLAEVKSHYRRMPLADAELTVSSLRGCNQAYGRAETGGQRQAALVACRASAGVLERDLSTAMPAPDFVEQEVPAPPAPRPRRRVAVPQAVPGPAAPGSPTVRVGDCRSRIKPPVLRGADA